MSEIRLIVPDDKTIEFYNSIWKGKRLNSYKADIFRYGDELITVEDVRELVYDKTQSGKLDNKMYVRGDVKIYAEIRNARKSKDYAGVVSKINGIYHTRAESAVTNVLNKEIDIIKKSIENLKSEDNIEEFRKGRYEIIDTIADGKGKKNRYSFATKFCSFLEPKLFPIFDSVSSTLLVAFLKDFGCKIDKDILGQYSDFIKSHDAFQEKIINPDNPKEWNYKEIDRFIWLYGRVVSKYMERAGLTIAFTSVPYIKLGKEDREEQSETIT